MDNPKAMAPLIVPEHPQIPLSTKLNLKLVTWNKSIKTHIPYTETNLPTTTTINSNIIKLQLKATWKQWTAVRPKYTKTKASAKALKTLLKIEDSSLAWKDKL